MREDRPATTISHSCWGIIPARAGGPAGDDDFAVVRGIIPVRAGGPVWVQCMHCRVVYGGLSPRARENRDSLDAEPDGEGLIPRVRGRTLSGAQRSIDVWGGLSPRARENPARAASRDVPAGIIPACAGQSAGSSISADRFSVHSRVCDPGVRSVVARDPGFHPRLRGSPTRVSTRRRLARCVARSAFRFCAYRPSPPEAHGPAYSTLLHVTIAVSGARGLVTWSYCFSRLCTRRP